jgi:hypothetical protein
MNKIILLNVFVFIFPFICCKNDTENINIIVDDKYRAMLLFEEKTIFFKDFENTREITLIGKIELKNYYGQPNYGENPETDKIERYYIFIPNDAIILEYNFPNNKDSILIREIQIVVEPSVLRDIYKNGEIYEIKGNIFLAHAGHHYTPILIHLNEINHFDFE